MIWLILLKIIGSVFLLGAVLYAVSLLARRLGIAPEIARKLIHVSLGLYCLTFPAVFDRPWQVWAVCALAAILFFAVRQGPLRTAMGGGLHAVQRLSYGELCFALSVALLFQLQEGHYVFQIRGVQLGPQPVLYVLPLLILTLCDAAAALVGAYYGRSTFKVEAGLKSWEGVAVFILTAWLASLIAFLLVSDVGRGDAVILALIAALFGALLEGASWRGLDNLFIPLGLYFILANLMPRGVAELAAASLIFVGVGVAMLVVGRKLGIDRHVMATAMILFFCIAIFSGMASLVTPAAAFVAYLFVARTGVRRDVPHDGLSLILVLMAVALAWFVVSDLLQVNTIYAFNLTFAALAGAILLRFTAARALVTAGVIGVAWLLAAVRILFIAGWGPQTWLYALLALVLIALVGMAAALARRSPARPWLKLSLTSFAAGFVSLPWSPP